VSWAAKKLEIRAGWPEGILAKALRLALILHDTGKLNREWQQWVQDWQEFIGANHSIAVGQAYAHTDNYTTEHRERARQFKRKRPSHAVEGAILAAPYLTDCLKVQEIVIAALTAIARHHTPDAGMDKVQAVQLEAGAVERSRRLLHHFLGDEAKLAAFPNVSEQRGFIDSSLLAQPPLGGKPKEEAQYLAYLLLARALRLADQRGTSAGTVR